MGLPKFSQSNGPMPPRRCLNFGFSSQSLAHAPAGLGHSGRPGPPLTTHAIGRYDCQNSHGRGQSSVLFSMNIWVANWDVYTYCFGSTLGTTKLQ